MQVGTVIAIYFIIWWVVLFAVLPWGVRSQQESGEVTPGTDPGAPAVHRVWRKLVLDHRDCRRGVRHSHGCSTRRPDPVRIPEADFQSAAFVTRPSKRTRRQKKSRARVPCSSHLKSSSSILFALCSRRRRFRAEDLAPPKTWTAAGAGFYGRTLHSHGCRKANRSLPRCHHNSVRGRSRSGRRARLVQRGRSE